MGSHLVSSMSNSLHSNMVVTTMVVAEADVTEIDTNEIDPEDAMIRNRLVAHNTTTTVVAEDTKTKVATGSKTG